MSEPGKEQSLRLVIVVSSGSGTGTITNKWDLCRWFRLVPPSESDTFDLSVKDGDGHLMLNRTGNTGTFSERIEMSMGIMKTIEITSASEDGSYIAKFDLN
jgi:hypothetical protein